MEKQFYLVTFVGGGYNAVYATSLEDAKEQLMERVGPALYHQIVWESLKTGAEAEKAEQNLLSLFW